MRVQALEDECKANTLDTNSIHVPSTTSWLSDANDWGDMNDNSSEQNGNTVLPNNATEFNFSLQREVDESITEEFSVLHVDDRS